MAYHVDRRRLPASGEPWSHKVQSNQTFAVAPATPFLSSAERQGSRAAPHGRNRDDENALADHRGSVVPGDAARFASGAVGGNLAAAPPVEVFVEISTGPNGEPVLSMQEFELITGEYYRFNISCPDVADDLAGWRVEATDLLSNSHLRVVSVGDIEIHLQGLTFRAIECDEVGSARFSFVPIRPGTYDLYVGNVPSAVGRPIGEAGVQGSGKYVLGRFVVE